MNYRSHTLQSPAHVLEIHLTQIPARDNSLILPRCGLPDLCSLQRSTDNLLVCFGAKWESLKCVFFLTLKPSNRCRQGGKETVSEEVGSQWPPWRWQTCGLTQRLLNKALQFIHMEKKFCGKWCVGQCSVGSLNVLPVPAWILSWYSDFLLQSKGMHVRFTGEPKLAIGANVGMRVSTCQGCTSPLHLWKPGKAQSHCSCFGLKQYNKKKYRNCEKV